jgi:hypothetical protein
MTEENGKRKGEAAAELRKESEISRPGLEKYALPGPWTEEKKRFVQVLLEEFGGSRAE